MTKALTAKALENVKAAAVRQEIADGLVRGLYFVVQPSGKASWAVRYRYAQRTRKYTLGTYPALSLKDARALAATALIEVSKGVDPAAIKPTSAASGPAAATYLVDAVIDLFIERHAKQNAARSWRETERILKREVGDRWRSRPLTEIRRADVHELLDSVIDRGAPIMANRVLAAVRRMCAWAAERDIIETSPCIGVRAPSIERSRDRVLSDIELRSIWKACGEIGWPFGPLIRLLLLLGQRRDEVGALRWSEVDLETNFWTIPRERVKNGAKHVVPLSSTAVSILSVLPRIVPPTGHPDFIFTTGCGRPVTGFSKAKERIDAFIAMEDGRDEAIPHWTFHDLRRTFASGCAKLGVNLPVIEKVLNHTSGSFGGIVGVYQRHSYLDEKRAALDLWGMHVEGLLRCSNTV